MFWGKRKNALDQPSSVVGIGKTKHAPDGKEVDIEGDIYYVKRVKLDKPFPDLKKTKRR